MEYGDHCPDVCTENMQYEGGANIVKNRGMDAEMKEK
jgi:hypothetical protein